ncbi:UBX domain-containing protein 4-like [Coccinella septempunctata]|uniref:UBX domain-containing protein 4-like n=1 Tax=Coccinella septempunctata TaxID=41139 RepID=UPI001D0706DB|nr:UBX domain-containing protein 4-like [Coccinella septempunctata]
MGSLWDEGDIAGAVTKAKQLGAVFIVFVEGKNELSSHFLQLFNNEEVLKKLKTNQFVAIKVEENSTAHQQFSAIYPHNSIPSVFFIGKNGKPLEILTKNVNVEEFNSTINGVIERSGFSLKADASTNIIEKEKELACNKNTNSPITSTSDSHVESKPSSSSSKEMSPEEKVQHAKELIEQRKEEKKKQEEEAEKQREIERRKIGQNVQQMKRWQQDESMKQLMEERNREKKENQAARDRVLAQIAQDKVERAARFSNQGSASVPSIPQATAEGSRAVPRGNTTRLQFRLPEGRVYTHEFQISDTLHRVHQYILNEITPPFTNYTISTTFPRREFNESDNGQTLLDLQLVPNAVILILPQVQGAVSSRASGMLGSMFWWIMAPIMSMYDFLVGFIFGTPSIRRSEPSTSAKRSASETDVTHRNQPKRQAGNSTEIKKQGNIHRLKERPDTDDENNTWNGNSTQQM